MRSPFYIMCFKLNLDRFTVHMCASCSSESVSLLLLLFLVVSVASNVHFFATLHALPFYFHFAVIFSLSSILYLFPLSSRLFLISLNNIGWYPPDWNTSMQVGPLHPATRVAPPVLPDPAAQPPLLEAWRTRGDLRGRRDRPATARPQPGPRAAAVCRPAMRSLS